MLVEALHCFYYQILRRLMSDKNNPQNIIEFYFLRSSAERFSSDLNHFAKEAQNFSDEQLYAIVFLLRLHPRQHDKC